MGCIGENSKRNKDTLASRLLWDLFSSFQYQYICCFHLPEFWKLSCCHVLFKTKAVVILMSMLGIGEVQSIRIVLLGNADL